MFVKAIEFQDMEVKYVGGEDCVEFWIDDKCVLALSVSEMVALMPLFEQAVARSRE